MSLPTVRPIVLNSLYKNLSEPDKSYLVISYKIDPRGEEHIAEVAAAPDYDLKTKLVQRVMFCAGKGTHVPLANSRVMLELENGSIRYAGILNPHPYSKDYDSPFQGGRQNSDRRISVAKICIVAFVPIGNDFIAPSDIENLLGSGAVPLPRRRPNAAKLAVPVFRPERNANGRDRSSSRGAGPSSTRGEAPLAPSARVPRSRGPKPSASEIPNDRVVCDLDWQALSSPPPQEPTELLVEFGGMSISEREKEDTEFTKKLISMCLQKNSSYEMNAQPLKRDPLTASSLLSETFAELRKRNPIAPLSDVMTNRLNDMRIIVANKYGTIIGLIDDNVSLRGLELLADAVGFVLEG